MNSRLVILKTFPKPLGHLSEAPQACIALLVEKEGWFAPWIVSEIIGGYLVLNSRHVMKGAIWYKDAYDFSLKPRHEEVHDADSVTVVDVMPWILWRHSKSQVASFEEALVGAYCQRNGYTDPFIQEEHWWAFPAHGVNPVRLPLSKWRKRISSLT